MPTDAERKCRYCGHTEGVVEYTDHATDWWACTDTDGCCDRTLARIATLTSDNAALREMLTSVRVYACHTGLCSILSNGRCDCGYPLWEDDCAALLKPTPPQEPGEKRDGVDPEEGE